MTVINSRRRSRRSSSRKRSKKNSRRSSKKFYFNPNDPKKSFDVYIAKNPDYSISIKYKTLKDVQNTIKKLERLFKTQKYDHKRIWQVGMIMYVRLRVLKEQKPKEYQLAKKYFKFLGQRTKKKTFEERKEMVFKLL